jgi:uncharacterized SAM-dependent methyltransferase
MSALSDAVVVRPAGPETLDRAALVALDADGSIVGRASLSRLYGLRAAVHLEVAPSSTITLALIDALEREARTRRLVRLEIDAAVLSDLTVEALRRWRSVSDERRASHLYLTWATPASA